MMISRLTRITQSRRNYHRRVSYRYVNRLVHRKMILMNYDAEIERLKAKVEALEDTLMLVYDSLNKRIDDLQDKRGRKIIYWGSIIAVIIGGIQIAIVLLSRKCDENYVL